MLNAVLKLEGPVIDDMKLSELLNETRTNIDHHSSVLIELHHLQVRGFYVFFYVVVMFIFLVLMFHFQNILCNTHRFRLFFENLFHFKIQYHYSMQYMWSYTLAVVDARKDEEDDRILIFVVQKCSV